MDTVTWIIGGALLSVASGLGGRLWSDKTKVAKTWCLLNHTSLSILLDEKISGVKEDLTRIEQKIDRINGDKP